MSASGLNTIPIANRLPKYGYPINEHMISLDDGRLMATMHIKGMPFECESPKNIEQAFNAVRELLNQLAQNNGSNLAVWSHIIKREDTLDVNYSFSIPFVERFSKQYLDSFSTQRFFTTDYYLTFVYKYSETLTQGESELYERLKLGLSVLKEFDASLLGIVSTSDGVLCENTQFLSFLLNHNDNTVPLTQSKVVDVIADSDWHFGYDVLELRNNNSPDSKYAVFYELDAYPATSYCGMWDFVLAQPYEFVLTQSMIFMKSFESVRLIEKQMNLIASSHHTEDELAELKAGKENAAVNNIAFGDYHCSLAVFGDSPAQALKDGTDLNSAFLSKNAIFKRANLKSPFTFLSSLPASTERVMPSPKTTTNLACTWSLHNYAQGKKTGNPIGDGSAILPLKSLSDTLYYLNCHASEPGLDVTGRKYAGHTMLLGASGAGKTTLEAVITAFLTRFEPQMFVIDYNRSTEMYLRVFGGEYFTFELGKDTGLNPFQLDDTPALRSFLLRLTCRIGADKHGHYSDEEEAEIKQAIDSMMNLGDASERGLSKLLLSIQLPELRMRLSKWCRSAQGQYAWCLDSPVNRFDPNGMDRVGFDATLLINNDKTSGQEQPFSEPILGVLFYLKSMMQQEGRLLLTIVEEFWKPANFPLTQEEMKGTLKAGRLKNEFMILSSQSPEDAIDCDIFPAIIQQTATKIYLPNPDAEWEAYKRCNVTQSEFHRLKSFAKTSRKFLIKQSNNSCFAKLDLSGFDAFFPILSGTTSDIALCESLRAQYGESPDLWLPHLEAALTSS